MKLTKEQKAEIAAISKQVAEDEKIRVISRCYVCGEARYTKADIGTTCYSYNGANGKRNEPCGGRFIEQ